MTVNPEDADAIIAETKWRLDSLSPLIRSFIPPMPKLLENIPRVAWKYTVQDLIEMYRQAYDLGKLR